MSAFKFIRSFILLVAGMAMIVHMVIPHDHHLSGPLNGLKDTCPVSQQKTDHHHHFPVHCHAFNDLAAEKFSRITVKLDLQPGFVFILWRNDSYRTEFYLAPTITKNTGKPFPDIYLPDFSPFRAPPSFI